MAKRSKEDGQDASEQLGKWLNPHGVTRVDGVLDSKVRLPRVFFMVRTVAKSGLSRVMSVYVIADNDLVCLDWAFSVIGGYSLQNQGFRVHGCGMDMCFAALDHVAGKLWGLSANDYRRGNL